jgi:DNA-directed RNA polymerase specialized sigma24 family protein
VAEVEKGRGHLEGVLARALTGDSAGTLALIEALAPIVRARAYGVLAGRGAQSRSRDVRQELDDFAQDILCALFADDARLLRRWDKARGLSLPNYVGLVTERHVRHVMRSGRRSPWSADATEADALELVAGTTREPEGDIASREIFARLWAQLKDELTPRGLMLFQLLVVEEKPVEDICATYAMTPDAVYAWRSRMMKRVRVLIESLSNDRASDRAPSHTISKQEPT